MAFAIFILIVLFFGSKRYFQSIPMGGDTTGFMFYVWLVFLGIVSSIVIWMSSWIGWWFLITFALIQLILNVNDNIFTRISSFRSYETWHYIYYSLLIGGFSCLMIFTIQNQINSYLTIAILVSLFLLFGLCLLLFNKNIIYYTKVLKGDDFDYIYWFYNDNYKALNKEKDIDNLGGVLELLHAKNYHVSINNILYCLIQKGRTQSMTYKPIGFWLTEQYYNKIGEAKKKQLLDRLATNNSYSFDICCNKNGILETWLSAAETWDSSRLILEQFLDQEIEKLRSKPDFQKAIRNYKKEPKQLRKLLDNSSFKEGSPIYDYLMIIEKLAKICLDTNLKIK